MLTWFAFKAGLKKFGAFVRRWGWIIILVAALIFVIAISVGGLVGRDAIRSLWGVIRKERQLHRLQVKEIEKIHRKEVFEVEEAGRNAIEAVKQAEEQFRDRDEELDDAARKRIEQIIKRHRKNPDVAARELADTFGFQFVPSGDNDA